MIEQSNCNCGRPKVYKQQYYATDCNANRYNKYLQRKTLNKFKNKKMPIKILPQ